MEFNWWVGHLFGGLRKKFVLNVHSLKIWVVHQLVYVCIYIYIYIYTRKMDYSGLEYIWFLIQICFVGQH